MILMTSVKMMRTMTMRRRKGKGTSTAVVVMLTMLLMSVTIIGPRAFGAEQSRPMKW